MILGLMFCFKKRPLSGPASVQSCLHKGAPHTEMVAQLRQASGNAMNGENAIRSLIPVLFLVGRPSAVSVFIVAVVVGVTINGEPRRTSPHIGQKISELSPSVADGDAAPAVIKVGVVVRVATSVYHAKPRIVCSRSFSNPCVPVGEVVRGIGPLTTTGYHPADPQVCVSDGLNLTAHAQAKAAPTVARFSLSDDF